MQGDDPVPPPIPDPVIRVHAAMKRKEPSESGGSVQNDIPAIARRGRARLPLCRHATESRCSYILSEKEDLEEPSDPVEFSNPFDFFVAC